MSNPEVAAAATTEEKLIAMYRGIHLLIHFADGHGRAKELVFSSGNCNESQAICDLIVKLYKDRRKKS